MSDRSDVESVRGGLEKLCRLPDGRTNFPLIEIAHRWRPRTVRHPNTMSAFSDETAWEFIADSLREGLEITYRPPLRIGAGDAYEMVTLPVRDGRGIYMKVALVPGVKKLVGLSFHYERDT